MSTIPLASMLTLTTTPFARHKTTVAVTAAGGGLGHVIIAGLRLAPWNVRIVGLEMRAGAPSAFDCDALHRVPSAGEDGYAQRALQVCADENVDLLIPGSDPELPVIAGLATELAAAGCTAVVSDPRAIAVCIDKLALAEHFSAAGVPFARTVTVAQFEEVRPDWPYPLVLKPRFGSGSVGARVVVSAAEWERLDRHPSRRDTESWVVQPFLRSVSWPEELWQAVARDGQLVQRDQIACQYVVSRAGEVLGRYAAKVRLRAGVAMASTTIEDSAVWEIGDAAVESLRPLGPRGPLNLQGCLTAEGLVLFEANPRFTGTTHVRALTGFREVEATVRHFLFGAGKRQLEPLLRSCPGQVGVREMTERVVPASWVGRFESEGHLAPPLPLQRAVVTGASGYLGRALVSALIDSGLVHEVIAPSRHPEGLANAWEESSVKPSSWDELSLAAPVDLVIHAAGMRPPTASEPVALFADDLALTSAVAAFVRRHDVPFVVYVSSQSVYAGNQPPPWDESSTVAPITPYGFAKAAGEAVVRTLAGGATRVTIVRLARLYGFARGMRWSEVVPRLVARALDGKPLPMHGDGAQFLDLLHVRDAAAFFVALLRGDDRAWNRSFNVGGGNPLPVAEIAKACLAATDSGAGHSRIECLPTGEPPLSFALDSGAARSLLGWAPRTTLSAGVRELAAAATTEAATDHPLSAETAIPRR